MTQQRTLAPEERLAGRQVTGGAFAVREPRAAVQAALASGERRRLAPADVWQLQRSAGNQAVQRLVAGGGTVQGQLTIQRQPTPKPTTGAEKAPVKSASPVGGAGRPLPPGSKVEVKPPPAPPTTEPGKQGEGEEEKAVEFHAEVSGSAMATRTTGEPTEAGAAGTVEAGLELPNVNARESKPGKPGAPRWKLLTNPEFHVALSGEIEKGKVEPRLRAEAGIDLVRLVWDPWSFRLAAVGGEFATGEGFTAKLGAGVEKELPKASGGFGFKGEAAVGLGQEGVSGEGRARLIYAPTAEKEGKARLYFFGELKGTLAEKEAKVEAAGTATLGIGTSF